MRLYVIGVIALLAAFLISFAACTDDKWTLVAHCATTQAQHVNDELICYDESTGAPLKFRKWMGETPEQACAYCEGR